MNAQIDDQALTALRERVTGSNAADADQVAAVIDELLELRSADAVERERQEALTRVFRSEAFGEGDLEVALRQITEVASETLGVGRASVWRFSDDDSMLSCIELYRTDEDVHESGIAVEAADFPTYFQAIRRDLVIAAHDAQTDPRLAEFLELYLVPLGIHSLLDAPIQVGGRLIGVLCSEQVGPARTWSASDQQFAASLGHLIGLAFENRERRKIADELRSMVDLAEQRLQTIERQRLAIADLSAPIIDVWDGVLALPVVGLVDTQRSIELTERLLNRIADSGAESVIVDLTGVDVVDTMTANHLLQMIRSASLLGAYSVLSGISPQIAQTLVQLDVDLTEITTVRNLKEALKTCLRRATRARTHPQLG